jgi:lectin, mannose-binding 1
VSDTGGQQISADEQQKLSQEYQQYQQKLEQQKDQYRKEHPDEVRTVLKSEIIYST